MTVNEFNKKYQSYLEKGCRGLSIMIPSIIFYLDRRFEAFIKQPNFQYSDIRMQFKLPRFDSTLPKRINEEVEEAILRLWEAHHQINQPKKETKNPDELWFFEDE